MKSATATLACLACRFRRDDDLLIALFVACFLPFAG